MQFNPDQVYQPYSANLSALAADAVATQLLNFTGTTADGILVSGTKTTGLAITSTSTDAINISGACSGNNIKITGVIGVGIYINKTANTAGTLKIHCHLMAATTDDSPNQYANEFKGEFLATSGTCDGIAAHYHMAASGTAVLRSIIGVAYLDSGITLSGTLATGSWLAGGLFSCAPSGIVNGTAVCLMGAYAGMGSCAGSTLTLAKYLTSLWVDSQRTVVLSSGISSLILATNQAGATALSFGIYLLNSSVNAIGAAIGISGAHTAMFDFTGATTGITEDNKAAADKAGNITIITPAGAVAYLNYYDGTRS
jgi:hypothetical protein